MNVKQHVFIAALLVSGAGMAQTIGATFSGHTPIQDAHDRLTITNIPLPPGNWEVVESYVEKSTGHATVDIRNVRLIQIKDGFLNRVIEIGMNVGSQRARWLDEPCKVENTIAKDDFGTSMFKQKCLTLGAGTFLQQENPVTERLRDLLGKRSVKHDSNTLMLRYTRYGDYGYYLSVNLHFFPTLLAKEDPLGFVTAATPWYSGRVITKEERTALFDAIFEYGRLVSNAFDLAYLREKSEPLPAFGVNRQN